MLHDACIFAISDSKSAGVPLDKVKHSEQKSFKEYTQYQAVYHERLTVLRIHSRTIPKERNADKNIRQSSPSGPVINSTFKTEQIPAIASSIRRALSTRPESLLTKQRMEVLPKTSRRAIQLVLGRWQHCSSKTWRTSRALMLNGNHCLLPLKMESLQTTTTISHTLQQYLRSLASIGTSKMQLQFHLESLRFRRKAHFIPIWYLLPKLHHTLHRPTQSLQHLASNSELLLKIHLRRTGGKAENSRSKNSITTVGCVIIMIVASTITPSGDLPSLILFRGLSWLRSQLCLRHPKFYPKITRCNFSRHSNFLRTNSLVH